MTEKRRDALDGVSLRLAFGYIAILAAILVVFGTVVVLGYWLQSNHRQEEMLRDTAANIRTPDDAARSNAPDDIGGPGGDGGQFLMQPEVVALEVAGDGSLTNAGSGGAGDDENFDLPYGDEARAALDAGRPVTATVDGERGALKLVSFPTTYDDGTEGVVQAAQPTDFVTGQVRRLVSVVVPFGVGAVLLAAAGGYFVSRRAMIPVAESFERQRSFIADASHELKTPLTLIRADAEVLARSDLSQDDAELARDLIGETDRMSSVLNDLLLLARLDAGRLPVDKSTFDLAKTSREVAARFSSRASEKEASIKVSSGAYTLVSGDESRTVQILSALLDNALRFIPQGGDISLSVAVSSGGAAVRVEDSGPGIAEEHLPRIFERFYRADESRTRNEGEVSGSGLGLAIARDLARLQGGDITSENSAKGGAVFTLTLPKP